MSILARGPYTVRVELVAKEIEELLEEVDRVSVTSSLRDVSDQQFIEDLIVEIYGAQVRSQYGGKDD